MSEKTIYCGSGKKQNETWLKATINIDITSKYNIVKNRNKYLKKVKFHGKEEPYYTNEMDYSFMPTYTFEELSFREKQFYYNNLKQNN
jgi:hypothetical protein